MALTRIDAEQHAEQIHAFKAELSRLEREKLLCLSKEQHQIIDQHHSQLIKHYRKTFNIDSNDKAKQLSLGMRIASLLGALALAASVWFLFYQLWDLLSLFSQTAVVIGASVASFALTLWLKVRDTDGYFCKMAGTLALACLALNTYVLGDIYNLPSSHHILGILGSYALLLGHNTQSRVLLIAAWLLLASYASMLIGQALGIGWQQAYEHPELWLGSAILLYLVVPLLQRDGVLVKNVSTWIGLSALSILAFWASSSFLPWPTFWVENLYLALALIACCSCIYLGIAQKNIWQYRLGTCFALTILLAKAFDWFWDLIPHAVFFLLVSLAAIGVLFALKRQRKLTQQEAP